MSSDKETLVQMQSDLTEAQRSKSILQAHLQKATDDLQKLSVQSALDRRRLVELNSDKANLTLRMRDQGEELKGKAKLLEVSRGIARR